MAFLNMARIYHDAANKLFELGHSGLTSEPIYFLYSHTVELALKAFLRSRNVRIARTHELTKLYGECRRLGLVVGPSDQAESIVSMLDVGNRNQRFRYFSLGGTSRPSLPWTREVVGKLIQAVELLVRPEPDTSPAPAAMIVTYGRAQDSSEG
jgi:hypothetical protein